MATRWIVGIDEAGLGPNLGPLVLAASWWLAPDDVPLDDLAPRWRPVGSARGRAWGDSKQLHQGPDGFRKLERALLAALATCDGFTLRGGRLADLWKCSGIASASAPEAPWRAAPEEPLPADGAAPELPAAAETSAASAGSVRLMGVRARMVFAKEFNEGVERTGNKAACLTLWSLELLQAVVDDLPVSGPAEAAVRVEAVCDRHGGRARYAPPLGEAFPAREVEIVAESPTCSRYRLGPVGAETAAVATASQRPATLFDVSGRRPASEAATRPADGLPLEASFHVGGERYLPTALASMLAKYLREREMRAWNAYWTGRLPGLRPTAGYPVDAARFRKDVASLVADDAWFDLWRNR